MNGALTRLDSARLQPNSRGSDMDYNLCLAAIVLFFCVLFILPAHFPLCTQYGWCGGGAALRKLTWNLPLSTRRERWSHLSA